MDDPIMITKDSYESLYGRIKFAPIDLIDLTPLLKSGITSLEEVNNLLNIEYLLYHSTGNCRISIALKLTGIQNYKAVEEECNFIKTVKLLVETKKLNRFSTIYDFAEIIGRRTNPLYFLNKIRLDNRVDPLLLSLSLQDDEEVVRCLTISTSNRFLAYRHCVRISKDVKYPLTDQYEKNNNYLSILRKEIVSKMMLYQQIFTKDIFHYFLMNELL